MNRYCVEVIGRYNCCMGDMAPSLLGTEELKDGMVEKFSDELQRMQEAVEVAQLLPKVQKQQGAANAIEVTPSP